MRSIRSLLRSWGIRSRTVSNGLKIETENSEGGKVEIVVVSTRPLSGGWASIGIVKASPKTRTIFRIIGSSSGATTTTVVMRPLS